MSQLSVETTEIPGLLVVRLPVPADNRGWFKENWQRAKMTALGLPDFGPVQNNVSFNATAGTTRGFHAEPWDKFVSVVHGRIFGAWVDLRAGETFGRVFTLECGPETAVFVPRGVGNAFQVLEDHTVYSYLVNAHWSEAARSSYTFVNLADETLGVRWPIALDRAELSEADRHHPVLAEVTPMPAKPVLVLGAGGQLGRALRAVWPGVEAVGRDVVDLAQPATFDELDWSRFGVVVNAAAYTAVDAAETDEGRAQAWQVNAAAVARLARLAAEHRFTLVQISSDYVFDGTQAIHDETEPLSPLGVYGQTKAAGDLATATAPRHYLVRTSWVVGDGANFVRTMRDLARRGVSPAVVHDQTGRLTFADDLARGIRHLVESGAPYGSYHLSCSGPPASWADVAREVFAACGRSPQDVADVTTEEYSRGKAMAPRPRHSVLDLTRIEAAGFKPRDWRDALSEYLDGEQG